MNSFSVHLDLGSDLCYPTAARELSSTMLRRFYIQNFRSIKELDLAFDYAEKQAPNGYRDWEVWPFLEDKTGRYVTCLAIYGPNASGKSSIIEAFNAFGMMLRGKNCKDFYRPNRLHEECINGETVMELEWSHDNKLYTYTIRYSSDNFCYERYLENGAELFSIDHGKLALASLATKTYNEKLLGDIFHTECSQHKKLFLNKLVNRLPGLHPIMSAAYEWLNLSLQVYLDIQLPLDEAFDKLRSLCTTQDEEFAMKEELINWVRRLDIGIEKIEYRRETYPAYSPEMVESLSHFNEWRITQDKRGVHTSAIQTWHRDKNGKPARFSIKEESLGTQTLMRLCCLMLVALKQGSVLLVDEIDRSLHPMILESLIRAFKDKEMNPNKAQLIFTTHTTDLLDCGLFRISEVGIISKTLEYGTRMTRLADYAGVRNVTDYRRRYLEGRFGGIPFPY